MKLYNKRQLKRYRDKKAQDSLQRAELNLRYVGITWRGNRPGELFTQPCGCEYIRYKLGEYRQVTQCGLSAADKALAADIILITAAA